jgi:hypothetical protein
MNVNFFALFVTSLFFIAGAQASTIDCTSTDATFVYHLGTSDIGSTQASVENLTLRGQTLIKEDGSASATNFKLVSVTLGKTVYWTSAPVRAGAYSNTQEIRAIKATSKADGTLTYSGVIQCDYSVYVGQTPAL